MGATLSESQHSGTKHSQTKSVCYSIVKISLEFCYLTLQLRKANMKISNLFSFFLLLSSSSSSFLLMCKLRATSYGPKRASRTPFYPPICACGEQFRSYNALGGGFKLFHNQRRCMQEGGRLRGATRYVNPGLKLSRRCYKKTNALFAL